MFVVEFGETLKICCAVDSIFAWLALSVDTVEPCADVVGINTSNCSLYTANSESDPLFEVG